MEFILSFHALARFDIKNLFSTWKKIIFWNFWKKSLTWKKMTYVINFDTYYKTGNHWIVLYRHWNIVPFLYSIVAKSIHGDIQNDIGDWHSLSKIDILFIMTGLFLGFIISYFWKWSTIIIKMIILAQLNLKVYVLAPINLKERYFTIPRGISLRNNCLENPPWQNYVVPH